MEAGWGGQVRGEGRLQVLNLMHLGVSGGSADKRGEPFPPPQGATAFGEGRRLWAQARAKVLPISRSGSLSLGGMAPGEPLLHVTALRIVKRLLAHPSASPFKDENARGPEFETLDAVYLKLQEKQYEDVGQLYDALDSMCRQGSLGMAATEMRMASQSYLKHWPREARIRLATSLSEAEASAVLVRHVSDGCGSFDATQGALVFASDSSEKIHELREAGKLKWQDTLTLNKMLDDNELRVAFLCDFKMNDDAYSTP